MKAQARFRALDMYSKSAENVVRVLWEDELILDMDLPKLSGKNFSISTYMR